MYPSTGKTQICICVSNFTAGFCVVVLSAMRRNVSIGVASSSYNVLLYDRDIVSITLDTGPNWYINHPGFVNIKFLLGTGGNHLAKKRCITEVSRRLLTFCDVIFELHRF